MKVHICLHISDWIKNVFSSNNNLFEVSIAKIFSIILMRNIIKETYMLWLQLQSYLLGCAFDTFSSSWHDRSYVVTLLVLAWFIPLVIICVTHIGIINRVKNSDVKTIITRQFSCGRLPYISRRVCIYNYKWYESQVLFRVFRILLPCK